MTDSWKSNEIMWDWIRFFCAIFLAFMLGGSKIPEETLAAKIFRVFVSFAQFPKAFLDAQAVVALSSPAPGSRVKLP